MTELIKKGLVIKDELKQIYQLSDKSDLISDQLTHKKDTNKANNEKSNNKQAKKEKPKKEKTPPIVKKESPKPLSKKRVTVSKKKNE